MDQALSAAELPAVLERCRSAYLAALVDRDGAAARRAVTQALQDGAPPRDVLLDVFPDVLEQVGHRWAVEELNVADEHFASALTQELICRLAEDVRVPPVDGRLAVVTGTPDELHLLGAQVLSVLLEGEGWEVLWLGASTPARDLIELVSEECPDVVALSTSTAGRVGGVVEVLQALQAVRPRPLVVAGGALFTEQAAKVAREHGADLVTSDVRALLAELRERYPHP
jgi:methanogenic corrinoid protein MtbC1